MTAFPKVDKAQNWLLVISIKSIIRIVKKTIKLLRKLFRYSS